MAELKVAVDNTPTLQVNTGGTTSNSANWIEGASSTDSSTLIVIPGGTTWVGVVGLSGTLATGAGSAAHASLSNSRPDSFPGVSPVLSLYLNPGQSGNIVVRDVRIVGGGDDTNLTLSTALTSVQAYAYGVLTSD